MMILNVNQLYSNRTIIDKLRTCTRLWTRTDKKYKQNNYFLILKWKLIFDLWLL